MKDDIQDNQSAALRLRCIRVLTTIDEESLRIVDSVLGRLVPSTPKTRAKPRANDAGPKATLTGTDLKGGAK
jgi:hypothetical protein